MDPKYQTQLDAPHKAATVTTAIARAVFLLEREGIGQFDREQVEVLKSIKVVCESHNTLTIEPMTTERMSKIIGE